MNKYIEDNGSQVFQLLEKVVLYIYIYRRKDSSKSCDVGFELEIMNS